MLGIKEFGEYQLNMLYKQISFSVLTHERVFRPWPISKSLNDKVCNKIKKKYGCEWSYVEGDDIETFFHFYYLDKRLIKDVKGIKQELTVLGRIANEFYFPATYYQTKRDLILDRNRSQYKKTFGCYWYYYVFDGEPIMASYVSPKISITSKEIREWVKKVGGSFSTEEDLKNADFG